MRFIDFEDFLYHKKVDFKIKKKGQIGYRVGMEYLTLSRSHISISNIEVESCNSQGVQLEIQYCSPDNIIRDQFTVFRYTSGRLKYDGEELNHILEAIEITEKDYEKQILRLYKQYFQFVINESIEHNPVLTSYCGWIYENDYQEYMPVSYCIEGREEIEKIFFNGQLPYIKNKGRASEQEFEYIKKTIEQIQAQDALLVMFSYCIHSVLWNHFHPYKINKEFYEDWNQSVFSLCLYGKDVKKCKLMANLFLNFFDIPKDWQIISRKYHVSATSVSEATRNKLPLYKSVPIIFTRKNNNFTSTSSIIKKVHKSREECRYSFFPVFISNKAVNVDEMVNCDIDSVNWEIDSKDNQELNLYHNAVVGLLYTFICYLTRLSNLENHLDRSTYSYIGSRYSRIKKEKGLEAEWLDTHYPEYLLYASIDGFCSYLEDISLKEYGNSLRTAAERTLLHQGDSVSTKAKIPAVQIDYLKLLHQFMNDSLAKPVNSDWIYVGIEREEKTEFYYLLNDVGFENYTAYLQKKKIPTIGKLTFNKLLNEQKLLKRPRRGTANTLHRRNKQYYSIPKHQFDQRFISSEIVVET